MYDFSIGVMLESFRIPFPEALKKAREMGAAGIQAYSTYGELAPENLTGAKRREFLDMVKSEGLVISALCGDLGKGFHNREQNPGLIEKSKRILDLARELETDIVTGNTGRRMGTPQGINYIHGKQRNQILRGADYESFVKYWVPVVGNIGIHDASWRGSFGGQIYQTGGSHGCINTPTANMSQLYEMVEVGMPVIMFY